MVRAGSAVLDAELGAQIPPGEGSVTVVIVSQDLVDHDSVAGEPGRSSSGNATPLAVFSVPANSL